MKKGKLIGRIFGIALVIVLLGGILGGLPGIGNLVGADEVVTFPDPNLEAVIRGAIGKLEGDIYASDLEGLTNLDARQRGITNISGLEYCINLVSLLLMKNYISDITPLSELTRLTTLSLQENWLVADISPLAELINLISLDLGMNQISDISPLTQLTNLTTRLDIRQNQITDISPLSTLASLKYLILTSNHINDISPLSTLTSLDILILDNNQISDISPLSTLSSLIALDLRRNQISNISSLSTLTKLRTLLLDFNQVSDISPLSTLTDLPYLGLDNNQISDLSPVSTLISLDELYLWNNRISDIHPLSTLTNLSVVDLSDNQIIDIRPLSTLNRLEEIGLGNNRIVDISPLSTLTALDGLELQQNYISDIKPLVDNAGLSEYERVWLTANPLSCKSFFDYIPQLEARGVYVMYDSYNATPDLKITADDISYKYIASEVMSISATVHNEGCDDVNGVAVRFRYEDTANGEIYQIGPDQIIGYIPSSAAGTASVTWNIPEPEKHYAIVVEADPMNTIVELDETNNVARVEVLEVKFLDKNGRQREVVGAAADGESQVVVEISNLPPDITIGNVDVQIMSEGDGCLENDATIEGDVFTQTYTAPEDFVRDGYPEGRTQGYREIDLSVRIGDGDIGPPPFYLFKPPVVLVHGIWSDAGAWTRLIGYLNGSYGALIYPINYYDSNDRHFSENKDEVDEAVQVAIQSANHNGDPIVVKQADVVTHSMGGILANMYIASAGYRNDINRVIAIGTPHSGSHIANYALHFVSNEDRIPDTFSNNVITLGGIFDRSLTNGAVEDLQVGSSANLQLVHNLKGPYAPDVPVYAISCDTNLDEPVGWMSFLYYLLGYLDTECCNGEYFGGNDMEEAIFGTKQTDFIVSCQSQRGGSARYATEYVVDHINETQDGNVRGKVCELLDSPVSSFDPSGFNPVLLSPPIGPLQLSKVGSFSTDVAATWGEMGTDNFISIVSPQSHAVYRPGEAVSIEAVCEEEVQSVLFIVPWDFHEDNSMPYTADFTIDEEFAGGLNAAAVTLGNEGILSFDFVELAVEPSTSPQEIRVYPPSPLYLETGMEWGLYVQGIYPNEIVCDVTYLSTTDYGSGNPAVATVSKSGVVSAISPGGTTIQIENGNASLELEVVVEQGNSPPNMPSNPSPLNHATGVSINTGLSWTGGDPDAGDTVTYDVYFGTSATPPLKETIGPYAATQSSITYDPGGLADGMTYYWQIVARDNHGIAREGPIRDFTTGQPGPTVTWNLPWGLDADPASVNIYTYPGDAVAVTLADVEWSMPAGLLIWHYGGATEGWRFYKNGWGASNTLETLIADKGYIGIVPTASVWEIPQG